MDPGYPDPKNRLQPHVPARAKARRVVQKSCFQSKHVRLMSDWQFKNGRVGKEDPLRASENQGSHSQGIPALRINCFGSYNMVPYSERSSS